MIFNNDIFKVEKAFLMTGQYLVRRQKGAGMKKRFIFALIFTMAFALAGCALERPDRISETPEETAENMLSGEKEAPVLADGETVAADRNSEVENAMEEDGTIPEENRILIAYFTWAENVTDSTELDAVSSASVTLPGNVGQMARWIQQKTGGDLFSIQVTEPYSADYDECLDRAADEKAENARPALKAQVEDLTGYDTVFIGFPNWWYTAPMAVFSFLEENDFAGKKVVLFCSHGTGGLASGVKDITALLAESDIEENVLGIYRDDIAGAEEEVSDWLAEIGY